MKKMHLFLITLLAITLFGASSIPAAAYVGTVGYWQFNERGGCYAYDASGNGLTAYINYPSYNGFAPSGTGLFFDGGSSCASVSDDNTANMNLLNFTASSNFTIQAWVYVPQNQNRWQGVITRGYYNGSSSWYGIWISGDNRWVAGSNTGDVYGNAVAAGSWHHVAEVQDVSAGKLYIYVDYHLMGVGPLCSGATSSPLFFGTTSNGESFYGYLDEVKISDYAYSAAEISADYIKYAPAKIASWRFEETQANNLTYKDATNHNFDANTNGSCQGGVYPGKYGYCIRFNRQGALWVNVNNRFNFSRYDNFTVSVWEK